MNRLFGFDIVKAPIKIVPKLKLSDDVPMTDEFRESMNDWLLDIFGTKDESIIPIDTVYMFGNTILMRPENIVRLINLC